MSEVFLDLFQRPVQPHVLLFDHEVRNALLRIVDCRIFLFKLGLKLILHFLYLSVQGLQLHEIGFTQVRALRLWLRQSDLVPTPQLALPHVLVPHLTDSSKRTRQKTAIVSILIVLKYRLIVCDQRRLNFILDHRILCSRGHHVEGPLLFSGLLVVV